LKEFVLYKEAQKNNENYHFRNQDEVACSKEWLFHNCERRMIFWSYQLIKKSILNKCYYNVNAGHWIYGIFHDCK